MRPETQDEIKIKVPINVGYLIGDFLRKFALRAVPTWQIAGFKIDSTTPNFSFSNGPMSSYLRLLDGRLVLEGEVSPGLPSIKKFTWDGKVYRSGNMMIEGLNAGFGDSLLVVLNYTSSAKSAEENKEVCRAAAGGEPDGFFAVPSRHVATKSFRFDVTPLDDSSEYLSIWADYDVVKAAYNRAIKSLSGLGL